MPELPDEVRDYLHNLLVDTASLSYLVADTQGHLTAWGGDLARYELSDLQRDERLEERVVFLAGLLPLDESPLHLSCVQTTTDMFADIHILHVDDADWVLLLDVTRDGNKQQRLQQKANDLHLMRHKLSKLLGA
jgi:hypothetical protein